MHAESAPLLVQLVPPGQGGVFDYAQRLQAEWAAQGVASQTLALSKALAQEQSLVNRLAELQATESQPCVVVLHFSGYGYGQRGICFWLLRELRALRAQRGGTLRLVVVFHELFATGPPWQSAFWVSGAQAWIAKRAARLADVLWTNTESHAHWLRSAVRLGAPLHARPVFSNVGEPAFSPALVERQARAVVFGSGPTRQRAISALKGLEPILQALGIEELVEAGTGGASQNPPASVPCRYLGQLPPAELGVLLQSSRFGLLDYESHGLAKSGVFAAYAAHGCVVLNTSARLSNCDHLQFDRDYLAIASIGAAALTPAALQARATRLKRWYQDHPLDQQARMMLALAAATA